MKKIQKNKLARARLLIRPKEQANNVYQIYLYDEITNESRFDWNTWETIDSETSADYFKEQLAQIPDNATIELYVNSNGGYVDEATAIYNQLVRHKAYKVGYVDGVAYSAASLVLMACDHIVMGLGTTVLIHNMWTIAAGNANYLRKVADDLDDMMKSNRQVYLQRMNITDEELQELMEQERYLTPEECLEYGICDEIRKKSEDDTEDDPENDPEDNPEDKPEDDPENDPENDPEDKPEDDKKQENVMQMMKQMMRQMSTLQKQNRQIMMQEKPEPKKPVENKCISFFDQFQ